MKFRSIALVAALAAFAGLMNVPAMAGALRNDVLGVDSTRHHVLRSGGPDIDTPPDPAEQPGQSGQQPGQPAPPADAGRPASPWKVITHKLAPGLTYVQLVDRKAPEHVFVLKVDPSTNMAIDFGLASRAAGGFERTSVMAARAGAVAAVNGDFAYWTGRPMHVFMQDGALRYTSQRHGQNFAISENERAHFMAQPKPSTSFTVPAHATPIPIKHVNDGDPIGGQIVEWTPAFTTRASANACTARLRPSGPAAWSAGHRGVMHPYRLLNVTCQTDAVSLNGRVGLSAKRFTKSAALLRNLHPGALIRVSDSMGWPDVADSMGGIPELMRNGRITLRGCDDKDFCGWNPRTGIGVTKTGTVLLVVVDGRRAGWSSGMRLSDFAALFKYLGAVQAMNLDGGGSATMVIRGKVVNKPSDATGERPVTTSVLVLNQAQATVLAADSPAPVDPNAQAEADAASSAAAGDPGSTGGLSRR